MKELKVLKLLPGGAIDSLADQIKILLRMTARGNTMPDQLAAAFLQDAVHLQRNCPSAATGNEKARMALSNRTAIVVNGTKRKALIDTVCSVTAWQVIGAEWVS